MNFLEYVIDKYWDRINSLVRSASVYKTYSLRESMGDQKYFDFKLKYPKVEKAIPVLFTEGELALYFLNLENSVLSFIKITDSSIYMCVSKEGECKELKFNNIEKVSLDIDKYMVILKLKLEDDSHNSVLSILLSVVLILEPIKLKLMLCEILNDLIKLHSDSTKSEEIIKIEKVIFESWEHKDLNGTMKHLKNLKSKYDLYTEDSIDKDFYYVFSALCKTDLKQFEEALLDLYQTRNLGNLDADIAAMAHFNKAKCLYETGAYQEALVSLNHFVKEKDDLKFNQGMSELHDDILEAFNEHFLEIPLHKRNIVFVTDSAIQSKDLCILKRDNMPKELQFPNGHPHINALYACHPLNNNLYMPIESYEKQLFEDKVNEFQRLMQALGATESLIVSASEKVLIEDSSKVSDVNAAGANKLVKGKVTLGTDNQKYSDITSFIKLSKRQRHEPMRLPYVPDNLVWYQGEIAWQRLAEKRLNGNLLEDEMTLSTSQVENMSKQRLLKIDAELKTLMANVNAGYSHNYASTVKSTMKYDCTIKVEFESVNTLREKFSHLEQNEDKEETSKLSKYAEEVQFMLDDGVIDDMERKMLDRKAVSFGLTSEEQKDVENRILFPDYSEAEVKYIQEIEEFKKDGEITDMEMKMLDRYATRYNLTETQKTNLNQKFL